MSHRAEHNSVRPAPSALVRRRAQDFSSACTYSGTARTMSKTARPICSCLLFAPLEGWRHVEVTDRHTAVDYAHLLQAVSDTWVPNAPKRHYMRPFPPRKRAASSSGSNGITRPSTEVGSNMAEIELSVLSMQCLDRRIPDKMVLTEEVAAWQAERNNKHAKADWQVTAADARVKLRKLYPSI